MYDKHMNMMKTINDCAVTGDVDSSGHLMLCKMYETQSRAYSI